MVVQRPQTGARGTAIAMARSSRRSALSSADVFFEIRCVGRDLQEAQPIPGRRAGIRPLLLPGSAGVRPGDSGSSRRDAREAP